MEKAIQLKHHLRAEPAGDDLVFLLGERRRVALRGRAYRLVIPLLDGRRDAGAIAEALAGEISPAEVHHAILRLTREGHVEAGAPEGDGLWQALDDDAPTEDAPRAPPPVAVRAMGGVDPQAAGDALAEAGVAVQADAGFVVVVTGDALDPALDAWNRRALAAAVPWALLKPGGVEPWIGPIFQPGAGPCWACLAHRLRHNRPVEAYLARRRGDGADVTAPAVSVPASRRAALSLAAVWIAAWLRRGNGPLAGARLVSLDLARAETRAHVVTRRPQCPACGDPAIAHAQALAPITPAPCPKRFIDDGGHRVAPPEATFARLAHHVSPITGLVASLGPAAGRDHPLRPVQIAVQRVCPASASPSLDAFHRVTAGKGRTEAQARTGALCEALERYSAAFAGDEPIRRARLAELGGDAVAPDALLCVSAAQYAAREALNAGARDPRHLIPLPFDEGRPLAWIPAWSLTHARRRWLPAAYCFSNLSAPDEAQRCPFDPSGHAAGNTIEEAIVQGFLERVERDAVSLWWYNRARRPAVDLASFGEPYFLALERHYASLGRRLWVVDLTTDLGLPAFAALARSDDGRYAIGFGCHPEARLGVQRSLTELNQVFDPSGRARPPWDQAAVGDADYLRPDEAMPARPADAYAGPVRDDLRDDANDCVQRAARLGLETIVVDQTRPDTGLRVVHVVVPGLRHLWPRFGPGRLYEAPVRAGWLDRPTAEADLNPAALLI